MTLNELTIPELQDALERLHRYLNNRCFGCELSDARVMIGEDGSQMDGYVIRLELAEVIRIQRMRLPDMARVEKY